MSHVDDGLVHAYLDSAIPALARAGALPDGVTPEGIEAHFALCTDCRSRLEAERGIRERAGLVLGDATPVYAPPPPFTAPVQPPRSRSRMRLSWAATVLLALGAGWWGREIMGPAGFVSAPATMEIDAAPRNPESVDAGGGVPSASQSVDSGAADAVAPSQVGATSEREEAVAPTAAAPQAGTGAAAGADAAADERKATAPERPAADASAALRLPPASLPIAQEARRTPQAAPPPPAAAPALSDATFRARASESLADTLSALVASTRADTVRWLLVRDAQNVAGLRLPGGPLPTVRSAPREGYKLVRTEQRLETGEMIEIVTAARVVTAAAAATGNAMENQRSAEASARPVTPIAAASVVVTTLPDGRAEVFFQTRDGMMVALRGPVDAARLRQLAERLIPLR